MKNLKTIKIDPMVHDKLKKLCVQNGYVFQFIVERALIEIINTPGLFTVGETKRSLK